MRKQPNSALESDAEVAPISLTPRANELEACMARAGPRTIFR
jgi:hypothetical protein